MQCISLKLHLPAQQLPAEPVVSPLSRAAKKPRILVLSVSAGHGHVRAAQAICSSALADYPALSMGHVDMMTLVPRLFRRLYVDGYLALVRHLPQVWGWLYRKTDKLKPNHYLESIRQTCQAWGAAGLRREVSRFSPDAIICTHFLPAELLAAQIRLGRLSCPVWVQITDFDLHQMWVHVGITGYFVATEQLARRLRAQGVAASRIQVTGIPVMPAFMAQAGRRMLSRQSNSPRMMVIVMGGGAGFGRLDVIARQLLDLDSAIDLIVLAGKNTTLLSALHTLAQSYPTRLTAVGFTDQVPELMSLADLAITKPGGLSSAECLVMGLPMILVNPIPGQEDRNSDYLLRQGVALRADQACDLALCVRRLLANKGSLAAMRLRALRLARPDAARTLLAKVATQMPPMVTGL